eukprot:GHVT01083517.1.p1 GENE.GHVT01083517.1~~GHVT01083517.1.p1  ORF type:complete len:300 (+),score=28.95 GHVT01083517.1:316-1215(+)
MTKLPSSVSLPSTIKRLAPLFCILFLAGFLHNSRSPSSYHDAVCNNDALPSFIYSSFSFGHAPVVLLARADEDAEGPPVLVKVTGGDAPTAWFRLKKNLTFGDQLFARYAERCELDEATLQLRFKDQYLSRDQTPEQLQMKNGDAIEYVRPTEPAAVAAPSLASPAVTASIPPVAPVPAPAAAPVAPAVTVSAPANEAPIELHVQSDIWGPGRYNVKKALVLARVLGAYANRHGTPLSSMQFQLNGNVININQTVQAAGITTGAVLVASHAGRYRISPIHVMINFRHMRNISIIYPMWP